MKRRKGASTRRRIVRKPPVILPPAEPEDVTVKKALNLPMFGPDIVIPVELHLWPAYQDIYCLEVIDTKLSIDEPLVLRVRRVAKEKVNDE